MALDPARFNDLARRVNQTEQDIRELSTKVAEFIGAAKGANKLLIVIVALSQVAQVFVNLLAHAK